MNKILLEMKELKLYYFATCYCEQYACTLEDPFKDKEVAKGYCESLSQYYQKYIFRSFIYTYTEDFDSTMKTFCKQNKRIKQLINKVQIFTNSTKLCNDVRNIIISFLITPPKYFSAVNI